jgi:hypothetical protein
MALIYNNWQKELIMFDSEATRLFFDYLNWENVDKAIEDMGLVENAPQEAINAYERFKEIMREANKNNELI